MALGFPTVLTSARGTRHMPPRVHFWPVAASVLALMVATPVLVVFVSLRNPDLEIWRHLWETQLLELVWNTLRLILGVGCGVLVLGTGLAWLITMYRFPGRSLFEWLLILPLAMPAYVIGFVFLAIFDYAGPVQSALRAVWGPDFWFPETASFGGLTIVMTLVLYPYVYMLARSAFAEQSASKLEAARALGASTWSLFWRVGLPLARPSIAAGLALALMEALADFGTVAIFGYSTFTVAIYRVWFGMFARDAATQLASLLMLFTLVLYLLERASRGRARFYRTEGTVRAAPPKKLRGWRACAATSLAGAVLAAAFVLPIAQLVIWIVGRPEYDARYVEFLWNTLRLGAVSAALAVIAAVVIAYGRRLSRSRWVPLFAGMASMGYALPGSVIAVGVLGPLAFMDHAIDSVMQRSLGFSTGLLITGSMMGLVFAYLVRFLAVSYQTVDASLVKITPSMDMAGRSLGARTGTVLRRIHLPLIRHGLATAAILVFVDVMKEMPATLLLRPFGYDTLAVRIWQLTSESFWEAAALPALTIVMVGMVPVFLLTRKQTPLLPG